MLIPIILSKIIRNFRKLARCPNLYLDQHMKLIPNVIMNKGTDFRCVNKC